MREYLRSLLDRRVLIIVAAAVILAGIVAERYSDERLVAERALVAAAVARADSAAQVAAELRAVTDSALAQAARADSAARAVGQRSDSVRVVYRRVAVLAPDTCAPVVAAADSALAAADSVAGALRTLAASHEDAARAAIERADVSEAALRDVRAAAGRLERAARPSLLSRLTPKPGLGLAAGVNVATGRPAAVLGATLAWRF